MANELRGQTLVDALCKGEAFLDNDLKPHWNTRRAAPVKGLEMAWSTPREMLAAYGADDIREGTRGVLGNGIEEDGEEDYLEIPVHVFEKMLAELVTRSQAEAIIAAKETERAEQWRLRREMEADRDTQKAIAASLEADNAALTERVKELEVALETEKTLSRGDWACQRDVDHMSIKLEALETQLGAAGKALRICLDAERARRKKLTPGAPATAYTEKRIAMIEAALEANP